MKNITVSSGGMSQADKEELLNGIYIWFEFNPSIIRVERLCWLKNYGNNGACNRKTWKGYWLYI